MEKGICNIVVGTLMLSFSWISSFLFESIVVQEPTKTPLGELTTNLTNSVFSLTHLLSVVFSVMGALMIIHGVTTIIKYISGDGSYVSCAVGTVVTKEKETAVANFGCIKLNTIVEQIKEKLLFLKNNEALKGDITSLLMIEQTEQNYLKKIFDDYMSIPKDKRQINTDKGNPYDITLSQLTTILQGLNDIENKIVSSSIMKQKANNIFLKEKVASM